MPPPSDSPSLHLSVVPGTFFVDQLSPQEPIPVFILNKILGTTHTSEVDTDPKDNVVPSPDGFWAISRTPDEITIVGHEAYRDYTSKNEPLDKWGCLKIKGPMPFGLVGVLSSLTEPLKRAEIPIFAQSTWNTDYLLVNRSRLEEAVRVLEQDGWIFENKE